MDKETRSTGLIMCVEFEPVTQLADLEYPEQPYHQIGRIGRIAQSTRVVLVT